MAYKSDINKSILNRNNFRLLIDKVPTVEYYVRTCNIPVFSFQRQFKRAGLGLDAFFPGDKASFDTLEVSFIVDEDLQNFIEMYDWIDSIVPISIQKTLQHTLKQQKIKLMFLHLSIMIEINIQI